MLQLRRSPTSRKRGSVAETTTLSRTVTSAWAEPTLSLLHATAASRTVPLNPGRSNVTVALPWSSSLTTPEKSASGACVGRLPSRLPLVSPPVWIAPATPCMPSISMPQRSRISTGSLRWPKKYEPGSGVLKPVRLRMPRSTAETVTRTPPRPARAPRPRSGPATARAAWRATARRRRRRACGRRGRSRTTRARSPGPACAAP